MAAPFDGWIGERGKPFPVMPRRSMIERQSSWKSSMSASSNAMTPRIDACGRFCWKTFRRACSEVRASDWPCLRRAALRRALPAGVAEETAGDAGADELGDAAEDALSLLSSTAWRSARIAVIALTWDPPLRASRWAADA